MIDYAERVEEVCLLLNGDFGMGDREAAEVLLAAKLPTTAVPYPWMVLETDCYAFDLTRAWFNFGGDDAISLPQYRVKRPRAANEELNRLLSTREGPGGSGLFIEPNYERPRQANYHLHLYPYLMQGCLRVRVPYPKARPVPDARLGVLRASVAGVMDSRWREETTSESTAYPPWLLYYAELLQRVSETQRDWSTLIANLVWVAKRRALLFNREVEGGDWGAVVRVMKDTVPLLTARILEQFASNGQWHSLRGRYPDKVIHVEIKRLLQSGIVWSHGGKWRLVDPQGLGADVLRLVTGQIEV